jgi:AraC family transcriptional regulator, transcriptional activator of pobA
VIHRPVVGERCAGPVERPVVHTHASVALLLSGSGVMHMGSAWTVGEGDVFLVPEGAPHYRLDHEPSSYVGVGLCMSCLPAGGWGPTLRALFGSVGEGACPVLRLVEADRDELARTLASLQEEPDAAAPWLVEARLGVLTALLRRASPAAAPRPQDSPIVARALDHIARHALEPLSLVDVARAVGRAPSHLATRVKAETGESVGAWIAHARMAQARELLLRGDDTVDVVAEKVGYGSPSHFHRTFRSMHGLSPAAWRDRHRRERG